MLGFLGCPSAAWLQKLLWRKPVHLAAKMPGARLMPLDEAARADVARWQFWDATHFAPPLATLAFEKFVKGMMGLGEPDADKIRDAMTSFRRYATVLDQRLVAQHYVVGGELTIADLTLADG